MAEEHKASSTFQYAEVPWEEPLPRATAAPPSSRSNASIPSNTSEKPKTILGFIHNTWTSEIIALVVSTIALLVTIAVLKSHSEGPLPSWPSGVTLNVFVAGMTVLFTTGISVPLSNGISQLKWIQLHSKRKSRLLNSIDTMDSASRGALGSFSLLFFSPQGWIAGIGASALILSLLAGVSTQLILQYPTIVFNTPESATLGYSKGYHSFDAGQDVAAYPVTSLTQGFMNGLYSSPTTDLTLSIPVTCSTGNCTWPTITTLAVCSKCTNLTSEIISGGTNPDTYLIESAGLLLEDEVGSIQRTFLNSTSLPSAQFFDLANYAIIGKSVQDTSGGFGNAEWPWALNCALYLCTQNITTNTTDSRNSQNVVSSWRNTTTADIQYGGGSVYPVTNITFQEPGDFDVDTSSWEAIKSFFSTNIFGGIVGYNDNGDLDYGQGSSTLRALYAAATNGTETNFGGPSNVMGGNIPLLFSQIATSMTNAMRTDPNEDDFEGDNGGPSVATGQATTMIRIVRVRWEWLLPPIVVLILTWCFLGAVILTNWRAKAVMWKSNALAVLNVDGGVGGNLKGYRTIEGLTEKAKSMKVRMEMSGGRVILREGDSFEW